MQKLDIALNGFTEVFYDDKEVEVNQYYFDKVGSGISGEYGSVIFQVGPQRKDDVNGCSEQDLLAVLIHRYRIYQASPQSRREMAIALTKLEEALLWTNYVENDRMTRGVDGTYKL